MRGTNIKLVLFSHEMWGTKEKNVPRRILISEHVFLVARPIVETKEISNRRMLKTCWLSAEKISAAKGNVRHRQRPFQVVKLIAIFGRVLGGVHVATALSRFPSYGKSIRAMLKLGRSCRTPARWFKQFHFLADRPVCERCNRKPFADPIISPGLFHLGHPNNSFIYFSLSRFIAIQLFSYLHFSHLMSLNGTV